MRATWVAIMVCLVACGADQAGSDAALTYDNFSTLVLDDTYDPTDSHDYHDALIACMEGQGFEYFQDPPSDQSSLTEVRESEWIARHGVGVSTGAFPEEVLPPDLVGYEVDQFRQYEDRNHIYVDSLTDAERDAYQRALLGPEPDLSVAGAVEPSAEVENGDVGCLTTARRSVPLVTFIDEHALAIDELATRIRADPAYIELESELHRCVNASGYDFRSTDQVVDDLYSRLAPIYGRWEGDGDLPDELVDELRELQHYERALAVAIDRCQGGWSKRQSELRKIAEPYLKSFWEGQTAQ